ncbi:hypothetical protein GGI13_001404 [Coemansia sp. RSA 455]|nr:hypothetical protein GGI14_003401 [Coemansia sp. S680]KAJ2041300.1 hypothetical protein H4S03_000463 [Coemansia sp. S3946]KAJ2067552.1 hypothetical protein GGI08_001323 [Coemansia sp. S2]KAJ2075176.1 hypothetical protein GGH13_000802 [Coemansia sp. S155-1]KAJ2255876.1 hypothetical protein GGI13_001404 [Coemansia sp. RSA 455]
MAIYDLLLSNLRLAIDYLWWQELVPYSWLTAGAVCVISIIYVIYCLYFAPLCNIPGSTISKLTSAKMNIHAILGLISEFSEEEYYNRGDIFTMSPNAVAISNPADCRTILSTHRFVKSEMYAGFDGHEPNIFSTTSPELSRVRRRQVGPAFANSYLNDMEPIILECGIHAIKEKWDNELATSPSGMATICYALHFSMVTFDIIGALGFGQRFNALRDNKSKMVRWVDDYNKYAMARLAYSGAHSFPTNLLLRQLKKSRDEFLAFGMAAAELRRKQLRNGDIEKPKDLLQILVDGQDPDSKVKMTDTQVTAENTIFMVAGSDTTSLTMTWTLHYFLLYPEVYRKVTAEVRTAFPRHHTITYAEGKARLPYLEACIFESMRVRPVSGVPMPRIVPEGGATFQGHFLPAGTMIGVNVCGFNHHQGTWSNPRKFMPERFLNDEKAKNNILTFSAGARVCPGRVLAQYEMITIIANVLKDYDFAMPSDSLFTPDRLDKHGNPLTMPRFQSLTVGPKYPERDCRVVISSAPEY